MANGGTLFLDEIGDISPALQVRLLRVLQDKTYEPLGSTKSLKTDVRIVAATNKSLQSLVEEGKFRQDLFYRINVVKLVLPPLRDRREDIPLLVEHFIRKFSRLSGKEIQGLSPEAFPMLMSHDFPGNVRELENIIEYATVVCKNGTIGIEHLPDFFRNIGGEQGEPTSRKQAVLLRRDGKDLHSRGPQTESVEQNRHRCRDGHPPDDPVAQDEAPQHRAS